MTYNMSLQKASTNIKRLSDLELPVFIYLFT